MGKKSAPEYAKTTYNTGGLFGTSTTDKKGTTFNPESWMTDAGATAGTGINTSLNSMLSNDFANDANFQAYQNELNRVASQNYDTSVLSNLANRGLMRSTGLQSATDAFNRALIDNTTDVMDNYYNRQANNLSNALNTQNALYQYLTGVNQGSQTNSQNVSKYNMDKWKAEQQANQAMFDSLAKAGMAIGGVALAPATGGASLALTTAAAKQ
jgi:hypothetical protein